MEPIEHDPACIALHEDELVPWDHWKSPPVAVAFQSPDVSVVPAPSRGARQAEVQEERSPRARRDPWQPVDGIPAEELRARIDRALQQYTTPGEVSPNKAAFAGLLREARKHL